MRLTPFGYMPLANLQIPFTGAACIAACDVVAGARGSECDGAPNVVVASNQDHIRSLGICRVVCGQVVLVQLQAPHSSEDEGHVGVWAQRVIEA